MEIAKNNIPYTGQTNLIFRKLRYLQMLLRHKKKTKSEKDLENYRKIADMTFKSGCNTEIRKEISKVRKEWRA